MWYDPAAAKADRGGPPRERGLNDVGRIVPLLGGVNCRIRGTGTSAPEDSVDCIPWARLRRIDAVTLGTKGVTVPETLTSGFRRMLPHPPSNLLDFSLNGGADRGLAPLARPRKRTLSDRRRQPPAERERR